MPGHLVVHFLKIGGWPAVLGGLGTACYAALERARPIMVRDAGCLPRIPCTKHVDTVALTHDIGVFLGGIGGGALLGLVLAQLLILLRVPEELLGAERIF